MRSVSCTVLRADTHLPRSLVRSGWRVVYFSGAEYEVALAKLHSIVPLRSLWKWSYNLMKDRQPIALRWRPETWRWDRRSCRSVSLFRDEASLFLTVIRRPIHPTKP